MSDQLSRRDALKFAGAAIVSGGLTGCGAGPAVVHAGRVVLSVAWPNIQRVVAAIVRQSTSLIFTAVVAAVERTMNATLSPAQASSLGQGGRLILRTEDGVEHEVPFTVES
jgi:hypothetical protein